MSRITDGNWAEHQDHRCDEFCSTHQTRQQKNRNVEKRGRSAKVKPKKEPKKQQKRTGK